MLLAFVSLALADSITLDTGATIEGDLARYEFGGSCQLSVTEGDLSGVILIVPCHRVQAFVRTAVRTPVPIGLEEEAKRRGLEESAPALVEAEPPTGSAVEPALAAPVELPPAAELPTEAVAAVPVAAEPLREPLYDEPLFPEDATTPILPAAVPERSIEAPRMDEPARHVSF